MKQCECGEPIQVTTRWNGLEHIRIYHDLKDREITNCPGCGQTFLSEDVFINWEEDL
jgi:uncharacterized Zn-finger protein